MQRFLILTFFFLTVVLSHGQTPGAGGVGINTALIRVFDGYPHFSAKALIRTMEGTKEFLSLPMDVSLSDGSLRAESDLSLMKSPELVEGAQAMLKQMGMDKVVSVLLPTKKSMLIIYPNLKAYADVPMPPEDVAFFNARVEKTKLGNETLEGVSTEKFSYKMTAEDAEPLDMTVWKDPAQNGFPVQIEMLQEGRTFRMRFRSIQMVKPDAKLYAAPPGFKRYTDADQLIQEFTAQKLKAK